MLGRCGTWWLPKKHVVARVFGSECSGGFRVLTSGVVPLDVALIGLCGVFAQRLIAEEMPSLQLVRKLLNMTDVSIEEVAKHFARFVNEDNCLDPPSFNAGFRRFVSKSAEQDLTLTRSVLRKLFEIFDGNNDGTVDFAELMAGLSVVCGGSRDQKVETAFSLFGASPRSCVPTL